MTPTPNSVIRSFSHSVISKAPGFTLVELLVVIGIIGVLAGVLFASFGSGTDAARAAKCLANMRNLAQATISCAANGKSVNDNSVHYFPLAGSRAEMGVSGDSVMYYEDVGWISWLSMNDEYGTRGEKGSGGGGLGANGGNRGSKGFIALENVSAYSKSGIDEKAEFAIKNGAIWEAVNGNHEVYVCPDHARAAGKKGLTVNWSYVMSAYFGYDWSNGSKAAGIIGHSNDRVSLNSSRLDRTLLFAELPFNDHDFGGGKIDTSFDTAADTSNDCVLQYKAGSIDGETFNKQWAGAAESIAFNHKSGKRWCAHVVFADGHTEKLLLPNGGGGLNREQLTALLCGDDGRGGGKNGASRDKIRRL